MVRPYVTLNDKFIPVQGLVACLLELAQQRQLNQHKLLRGTGIFDEDLLRPDFYLSLSQLLRLLKQFNNLMPGQDAAFQLGHRLFPASSAEASALLHSRNLTQALRLLRCFRLQLAPLLFAHHYKYNDYSYLQLNDAVGLDEQQYQFVVELYCCLLVSASRYMLGERIPFHFEFPFQRPRHIYEYEEHLGLKLTFGRPSLIVKFAQKWLTSPLLRSSQLHRKLAMQQVNRDMLKQTFIEMISNYLHHHRQANLQQVSEHLNMSTATLKRRLKEHNLRFSQLQDRINMQLAFHFLTVQGLSNEVVAEKLAFHDAPNFRRACKRWTGLTPTELKALALSK
ncbi:helix-turn-helix domain-containing protein [Pseudoalteromonas sp. SCQQ13]|uniref:helix-turn-helix domain-containing protein n=1 Tax=Pseudoalteromonas sp. SCQQ13 TaxID=2792066 RepID=UPI0018CFE0F8|nr:AraC family transcriptional regulator ligand-binding domain-containing protein [Pseudoalteromonas sp. SCQQ13]MBH0093649.1 AraC family transcriptional regulator ligand-binding domain-containing protein [Pseudoalteromonas sp. SCQQ13]